MGAENKEIDRAEKKRPMAKRAVAVRFFVNVDVAFDFKENRRNFAKNEKDFVGD
jgi:hypothetical protein